MKLFIKSFLTLSCFSFILLPQISFAESGSAPNCAIYSGTKPPSKFIFKSVNCDCIEKGICNATDFSRVVINVGEFIFGIAGVAALLFLIFGGFLLIVSEGNQNSIDRGKLIIKSAIIGIVIIFTAWIVINGIVVAFTGDTTGTLFNKNEWFKLDT